MDYGAKSKIRYVITDEILAQTNLALKTISTVTITETNALIYATVETLQESVGEKESRIRTHHNKWLQRRERKINRLVSDVSKLSEMAKGNATNKTRMAEEAKRYPCNDRSGSSKALPSRSRSTTEEL